MSHSTYYVPIAFSRTFQDPQSRSDTPQSGSSGSQGGTGGAAPMTGGTPAAGGTQGAGTQAPGGSTTSLDNPMPKQAQQQASPCGGEMIWMMPVFLGLMYFMIFRPEQKRKKQQQELLAAIKVGDHVVMLSGMHGDVISLTEKTVTLRVDSIAMTFDRSAVGRIDRDEAAAANG